MSSFLLTMADVFPPGTVVGAYLVNSWATWQLPPAGAPPVAAVETQTMGESSATFTTLTTRADYFLGASVGGAWRYIRVRVDDTTTQLAPAANTGFTLVADSQALADAAGDPTLLGKVAQYLLRFQLTGIYDRPGPVWVDETGRLRAWFGWHRDNTGGGQHRAVEVKTSVSPTDPYNPNELVTRVSVRTENPDDANSRFAAIILNWLTNLELNWGHQRLDTTLPLKWRMPIGAPNRDGTNPGGTGDVAVLAPQIAADGTILFSVDLGLGSDASKWERDHNGYVRVFRDTDAGTGTPFFVVYKGDGTATEAFKVNAKTGGVETHGTISCYETSSGLLVAQLKSAVSSGDSQFDIDAVPQDATHGSIVRHGRNVTTSGTREERYYQGDGSATITAKIDRAAGKLYGLGQDGRTLKPAVLDDDPRLPASAPGFASKTADQDALNTAALADVADLGLAVAANAVYVVDADLICDGTTTADLALGWSLPAGATLDWITGGPSTSATTASSTPPNVGALTGGSTGQVGTVGKGTNLIARPHGILRTAGTAGTLQLRFAQVTADNAAATTIKARSALRLVRVA